ncbi:MAG: M60 family peptidase N-terminal accessory domain-containing protein [Pseudomonadota bacterium]
MLDTLVPWALLLGVVAATQVFANPDDGVNARFQFDNSLQDTDGEYTLTGAGVETAYVARGTGTALELAGESWLEVPQAVHTALQRDQSLSLSVDFYFKDTGEDESVRVILSNKDWAYDVFGLKIEVFNERIEWQPEGIIFVQFNIGVGTREVATRFFDLPMDQWHTATVDIDFVTNEVAFGVNGRKENKSLNESEGGESIDPTAFISHLGETPFRLGAHQSAAGVEPEWRNEFDIENGNTTTSNLAEVYLDNFVIQSPKPDGDAATVNASLRAFNRHLSGEEVLGNAALEAELLALRENLSGIDFAAISDEAGQFVSAHAEAFGPVYAIVERNNLDNVRYDDLPATSKAYVDLGVWMLESGLPDSDPSSAAGVTYIEHREWPGALAPGAERVTGGSADIRAEYVRDPGYLMGGMRQEPESELAAYLYRPTGFYAPAGEVVTVTVPDALVDSGLHLRVGVHADNHSLLASTSRFPKLTVDYRIDAATTEVLNPFGGNIYVLVPQDTDLGWHEITIDGAARAPYFSTRSGYETPSSEWSAIRQYPGVTADFESDKFMVSVPSAQIRTFDEAAALLERWDQIMDIFQVLHGRPMARSRAEAYVLDSTQLVVGSFPGGYPVTPGLYAEGPNGITDGFYSPFAVLNEGNWEQDLGLLVMLHELGHHHYGRFLLEGEQESYVNVPAVAVLQQLYGLTYDEALSFSGYQYFSRTDAAIDWMVTQNFRNGDAIGFDPTTEEPAIETSYQARGHAKYVDLAAIFGTWEALGDVYRTYYEDDLVTGTPPGTQAGVTHDDFLVRGSEALGCNLASLFHFWGIHPSASVAEQIVAYPACDGAAQRLIHYLDSAPRTNGEIASFYNEKTAVQENQLNAEVYGQLLESFDVEQAQEIRDVGGALLEAYFGVTADEPPSVPGVLTTALTVNPDAGGSVEFAWEPSVDPQDKPLTYAWALLDGESGEEVLSRAWVEGTSVSIGMDELSEALGLDEAGDAPVMVTQQVTTSDTFTVVSSSKVATTISTGPGDDSGGDETGGDESGGGGDAGDGDSGGDASPPPADDTATTPDPAPTPGGGGGGGGSFSLLTLFALVLMAAGRRQRPLTARMS